MRGYIQIYFLCDTNYFVVCIAIILIILKTLALYNDLHVDYNMLHLWGQWCSGKFALVGTLAWHYDHIPYGYL